MEYINLSAIIGGLVSSRICTLYELQSVYSLEDALNLWEVLSIDGYNQHQAQKRQAV
ncbi:hypothetical protein LVJ85_05540 [Neisseria sp. Dent CA1/247]|uniref:hypothetical protein n=1 Tax=Neisseria sp. Dent CA1/247 TaxID=2912675 RepID=UPI001FD430B8|nr:hypothetical protein [Neisseria sp. Dent CA1/247]UOO77924.1 hypothetical protein LVJ85_05540 [Neisseria sp. Dent CA1/247]